MKIGSGAGPQAFNLTMKKKFTHVNHGSNTPALTAKHIFSQEMMKSDEKDNQYKKRVLE